MANRGFNGSQCTFAGVTYAWVGIDLSINGQKVDVTDATMQAMLYQVGLPDYELTLEIKGSTVPSVGQQGAIVLTWKDGNTASLPSLFIVNSVKVGGKLNQPIDSTIMVCPSTT